MATITPNVSPIEEVYLQGRVRLVSWLGVTAADTCLPLPRKFASRADRSVQAEGTFGTGGCTIEGSLDGVNYRTLNDPQGNPLVINGANARIESVLEPVLDIRPVVSGDANLNIYLLLVGEP